MSEILYS